jgi:hypothetical protein
MSKFLAVQGDIQKKIRRAQPFPADVSGSRWNEQRSGSFSRPCGREAGVAVKNSVCSATAAPERLKHGLLENFMKNHFTARLGEGRLGARLRLLPSLLMAMVVTGNVARGATAFWAGGALPGPGDWNTCGNWAGGSGPCGAPAATDDAEFSGAPATYYAGMSIPNSVGRIRFKLPVPFSLTSSIFIPFSANGPFLQDGAGDAHCFGRFDLPPTLVAFSGVGAGTLHMNGCFSGSPSFTINGARHRWSLVDGTAAGAPPFTPVALTVNNGVFDLNLSNSIAFSGPVTLNGGITCIYMNSGAAGWNVTAPSWTVSPTATLKCSAGTFTGPPPAGTFLGGTLLVGGTLAAGCSVGTAPIHGDVVFQNTGRTEFELGAPGIGGTDNDLFDITGNLTLDGALVVLPQAGFGPGRYRLFNYTGTLTDFGVNLEGVPNGFTATLDTATSGEVNLVVQRGLNCCTFCVPPFPASLTVTVQPGLNFLVNPLCHGAGNAVGSIVSAPPDGSSLLQFNKTTQTYADALTFDLAGSGGWVDNLGHDASNTPLPPGEGFILINSGPAFTLTFTGCNPDCGPRCPPTNGLCLVGRTGARERQRAVGTSLQLPAPLRVRGPHFQPRHGRERHLHLSSHRLVPGGADVARRHGGVRGLAAEPPLRSVRDPLCLRWLHAPPRGPRHARGARRGFPRREQSRNGGPRWRFDPTRTTGEQLLGRGRCGATHECQRVDYVHDAGSLNGQTNQVLAVDRIEITGNTARFTTAMADRGATHQTVQVFRAGRLVLQEDIPATAGVLIRSGQEEDQGWFGRWKARRAIKKLKGPHEILPPIGPDDDCALAPGGGEGDGSGSEEEWEITPEGGATVTGDYVHCIPHGMTNEIGFATEMLITAGGDISSLVLSEVRAELDGFPLVATSPTRLTGRTNGWTVSSTNTNTPVTNGLETLFTLPIRRASEATLHFDPGLGFNGGGLSAPLPAGATVRLTGHGQMGGTTR